MFLVISVGLIVIIVNVIIQGIGNVIWLKAITRVFKNNNKTINTFTVIKLLVNSFLFFTILHSIQTIIWTLCYLINPVTKVDFTNTMEGLYFSFVTFTTLGYGDVTISSEWKLLSGLEAINGIMLIGWSTALMYSLIQHIYTNQNR